MRRLLIANRGEIAVRVMRTAREMGLETVAVFAEDEAGARHVREADRGVSLGAGVPRETYLDVSRVLDAARASDADAIHPGYGFLSESPALARAVEKAGLLWVGPPAAAIEEMGDKVSARRRMEAAGVPVVPGSAAGCASDEELLAEGRRMGFPLLVKASAGGGGKGMSRVDRVEDLPAALAEARRIAGAAFSDERVYLEAFLARPRHVEFQVFADVAGNTVHLFERECSVQRRHQKIVEETPSTALDPTLRARMGEAAVAAARAVSYVGAGTVEFLLDGGRFYFLEMNTRLQVEHAITEETLGIDLVRAQIEVASGEPLAASWREGRLSPRGHAIEMRLYAEDPVEFLPRAGTVLAWEEPAGPGIRVDSGVEKGSRVGLDYDPLLAKLIAFGPDRPAAIARAARALKDWVILGVETNQPLLAAVLASEEFRSGRYATDLLANLPPVAEATPPPEAWIAAALALSTPAAPSGAAVATSPDPWGEMGSWRPGR